jgi:hypothetical protein
MTADAMQAASELAALLTQENAALRRLDFAAAVALLPAKEAACANLTPANGVPWPPEAASLGQRLVALAAENRALLEHAIVVQTRIVGIVAQAARPRQERSSYAPGGQRARSVPAPALTLSARA